MQDVDDIHRLFQSAAQVIMRTVLRDGIITGADARKATDYAACVTFAIECPPIDTPRAPTTRAAALPQVLLRGPFKGIPNFHGVAFYIGIGFITVLEVSATRYSYQITAIDGDGVGDRLAFLTAARDLLFNDVTYNRNPS